MKILFIHPNPDLSYNKPFSFFERLGGKIIICPRLAFPMLASVTSEKHSIKLIDEKSNKINFSTKCDLVCISAMTNEITRGYQIADEFRRRGKKVVIGGCHVSALPEEGKKHADSIVIGEAEHIWPQVIEDFENNNLKPIYFDKNPPDMKNFPIPKRNIVNGLIMINGVQSSRGCPNHCKYCYVGNSPHGRIYRKRTIEEVIEEIKKIKQKIIVFYDTSLTIDLNYTKNLCKALKKTNKKFIFLGNIDILNRNEELIKLSKEAGCIQWNIGFESVSQKSLDEVNKNSNTVENYIEAVKKIHNYGMYVHGFFMFGFDHDSKKIFNDTMDFIRNAEIDSADFSTLTPFPGTPVFDEMEKQNRIYTKDWSKYHYQGNIVIKHNNFTVEDLNLEMKTLLKKYYSYPEIKYRLKNSLKRGFFNFHPFLFIVDNIFTKYYVMKNLDY